MEAPDRQRVGVALFLSVALAVAAGVALRAAALENP